MLKYLSVILIPFVLFGGEINKELNFIVTDLGYGKSNGYDVVTLPGFGLTGEIGKPQLPQCSYNVLVPPGATVTKIEVISSIKRDLPSTYKILPFQPPVPIGHEPGPFVEPDQSVYSLDTPYPKELVEYTGTGTMSGYRLAGILVCPFQYIPKQGKLVLYERMELRISYELARAPIKYIPEHKKKLFEAQVKGLIINPEDVEVWAPPSGTGSRALPAGSYNYVAVVNTATDSAAMYPLVYWKKKKGLTTKIATNAFLAANGYTWDSLGIKNFIAAAEVTWGASYFLLVGDKAVLPKAVRPSGLAASWGEPVATDHWYADTDPIPGVLTQPDYEDVYVGRAPVANASQCTTFVIKTLRYEKSPGFGQTSPNIFLPSCLLWATNYGYAGDTIATITPTPPWIDEKRKDWLTVLTSAEISDSMGTGTKAGTYGTYISGHGINYGWGTAVLPPRHDTTAVKALTNFPKLFFGNSIACDLAYFDTYPRNYVCMLLKNRNGGAVGFIGNSRLGIGYTTQYGEDLTEGYCVEVWRRIFGKKTPARIDTTPVYKFGPLNFCSHNSKIADAQTDDYSEHCFYCLNLFGDPETEFWSEYPDTLKVTHAGNIYTAGPWSFNVWVKDNDNVTPISGARVCFWCKQEASMFYVAYTDASGFTYLPYPNTPYPTVPNDTMWITVTKHNSQYIPYEGFAIVTTGIGVKEQTVSHLYKFLFYSINPSVSAKSLNLKYEIAEPCKTSLKVYNSLGRLMCTLLSENSMPGRYNLIWDLKDKLKQNLANGVYFIKFETDKDYEKTQKLILMH